MHLLAAASSSVAGQFVELGLTLLALGVLARLASRIGVSSVPMFLLAGLFFGKGGASTSGSQTPSCTRRRRSARSFCCSCSVSSTRRASCSTP